MPISGQDEQRQGRGRS